MVFNEDSRVKIPAILHLMRLGYHYIPFAQHNRIESNNIFPEIFTSSICRMKYKIYKIINIKFYIASMLKINIYDI
jgi:hypothetical protein